MTPLDTPEYFPPRYCVKLKHKTKGRNTVYKSSGGADWFDRLDTAIKMFCGGLAALQIEQILKDLHWISIF